MTTTVKPSELGATLRRDDKKRRRAVHVGLRRAAHRGRRHLVAETKRQGKVHTGQLKAAWRVVCVAGQHSVDKRQGSAYAILNDAPHAGIIELSARPHPVSREGYDAIRRWVQRKLLGISARMADENEEVDVITRAIVRKLELYGQEPTYLVRDSLSELRKIMAEEIERAIKERLP